MSGEEDVLFEEVDAFRADILLRDVTNSPSVLSCSGEACPDAASWRRLARIGFVAAAVLTWLTRDGVMGVSIAKDETRGVDALCGACGLSGEGAAVTGADVAGEGNAY